MTDGQPASQQRSLPPQVTTPLLTLITQQSLDEDYLHAAERRVRSGEPPRQGSHRLAAAAVVLFGLLVGIAAGCDP